MRKLLISTILTLLLFSCENKESNSQDYKSIEEAGDSYIANKAKSPTTGNSPQNKSRKVIWNANLEFQVTDVNNASQNIKNIADSFGAFVSNMKLNSGYSRISNKITIRVESSKFDSLLNAIKGESIFMKSIEINSKDVTEEFIDIESRLKTKKDVRDRYIEILRNKTGDIKDVIEAEEAIRKITEEIEAKEGRLRYLNDKVKFSTINLNVYQEVEYRKEPNVFIKPYSEKLTDGLKNGWSIITNIFLGLVNIWPLLLIVSFIIWKRKWLISKFK